MADYWTIVPTTNIRIASAGPSLKGQSALHPPKSSERVCRQDRFIRRDASWAARCRSKAARFLLDLHFLIQITYINKHYLLDNVRSLTIRPESLTCPGLSSVPKRD